MSYLDVAALAIGAFVLSAIVSFILVKLGSL